MSTRAWIGLIVAVFLGLGGWWAVENLTIEEVRYPGRPKNEVLRNPYYVAEKLMRQGGAEVQSRFGHRGVPEGMARGSVLLLPIERRTLAGSQVDDLLAWVRAGGHLIVVATAPERKPAPAAAAGQGAADAATIASARADPLLAAVGVSVESVRMKRPNPKNRKGQGGVDPAPATSDEEASSPEDDEDEPGDSGPLSFLPFLPTGADGKDCPPHSEGGRAEPRFPAQWMRLCLPQPLRLKSATPPEWSARAGDDDRAVTQALGQGRVSVLTSTRLFRNEQIDRGDHADFLAALLGGSFRDLRVTIVVRDDVDNLAVLAWEHAPGVVIALALLVLAWLVRSAARIGPVSAPLVPVRRSLLEHVQALGEYLWRERTPHVLWEAAAARTRQAIARKVPRFANDGLLAAHLARRTGLAEPDVLFALNPGDVTNPHDFVRAIATLEQLRKSL